jgi:hypothetical protein
MVCRSWIHADFWRVNATDSELDVPRVDIALNSVELPSSLELINLRAALNKSLFSGVVVLQQGMSQIFAQAK